MLRDCVNRGALFEGVLVVLRELPLNLRVSLALIEGKLELETLEGALPGKLDPEKVPLRRRPCGFETVSRVSLNDS